MTISKINIVGAIALSFLLAVPGAAFAGKSGGNTSFNYTKVEQSYKSQTQERTKKGSGRATYQNIPIKRNLDKASP